MKTTRVGGGHPFYGVLEDADGDKERTLYQQDLWHYTIAKMVDACMGNSIKPFYGPFGDFSDSDACRAQFRNAFLQGCLGTWELTSKSNHLSQRSFSALMLMKFSLQNAS